MEAEEQSLPNRFRSRKAARNTILDSPENPRESLNPRSSA